MKKAFVFFCTIIFSCSLQAQVFQADELSYLISRSNKDSIMKTERLAALKFHKLINEYRKTNKSDTLAWDDILWLAARNHSVWMGTNSVLSHSEKEGTKNFTGSGPGERYDYASAHNSSDWSAENALYNWSDDGATIEEISTEMAIESFKQWKDSPGHEANMRAKRSRSHGVAFYLEPQGAVWATDLFSYQAPSANELANDNSSVIFELIEVNVDKKRSVKRMNVIELEQTRRNLLEIIEGKNESIKNKAMEKATRHHAEYMANLKTLTHHENKYNPGFYGETHKKRMMKASLGLYFFLHHKIHLNESIAIVKADIEGLDITELASGILTALDNDKKLKGNLVSVGYGISIIQVKKQLKVYAVRMEGIKKTAQPSDELSDK